MSMRLVVVLLALGGLWQAGCAGGGSGVEQANRGGMRDTGGRADGPVAPPADAQWTIHCYTVSGPDHVSQARRLKDHLARNTALRDWYVIHGEQNSTLFHGYYRSINDPRDPAETSRAQSDRRQIEAMRDAMGDVMFRSAMFVPFEQPDPDGPPEWNLLNAEGAWTLEIAVYRDSPDRKQVAVEAVREARAMGIEAYYFHGPVASSVCIGAWPAEAVKAQESDAARTRDPNQPIMVVPPGMPVAPNIRDADGREVKVFQPRLDPVDPTLIAALREYTTYAVNGYESGQRIRNPQTGEVRFVPDRPQLVDIPQRGPSMLSGGAGRRPQAAQQPGSQPESQPGPAGHALQEGTAVVEPAAPAPMGHPQPPQPVRTRPAGVGQLRSIGD